MWKYYRIRKKSPSSYLEEKKGKKILALKELTCFLLFLHMSQVADLNDKGVVEVSASRHVNLVMKAIQSFKDLHILALQSEKL